MSGPRLPFSHSWSLLRGLHVCGPACGPAWRLWRRRPLPRVVVGPTRAGGNRPWRFHPNPPVILVGGPPFVGHSAFSDAAPALGAPWVVSRGSGCQLLLCRNTPPEQLQLSTLVSPFVAVPFRTSTRAPPSPNSSLAQQFLFAPLLGLCRSSLLSSTSPGKILSPPHSANLPPQYRTTAIFTQTILSLRYVNLGAGRYLVRMSAIISAVGQYTIFTAPFFTMDWM